MESTRVWLQYGMQTISPTPRFVSFAQAVLFRGADVTLVWRELVAMVAIGAVYYAVAQGRFRRAHLWRLRKGRFDKRGCVPASRVPIMWRHWDPSKCACVRSSILCDVRRDEVAGQEAKARRLLRGSVSKIGPFGGLQLGLERLPFKFVFLDVARPQYADSGLD